MGSPTGADHSRPAGLVQGDRPEAGPESLELARLEEARLRDEEGDATRQVVARSLAQRRNRQRQDPGQATRPAKVRDVQTASRSQDPERLGERIAFLLTRQVMEGQRRDHVVEASVRMGQPVGESNLEGD
jgi:hypothetical protein